MGSSLTTKSPIMLFQFSSPTKGDGVSIDEGVNFVSILILRQAGEPVLDKV